MRRVAQARLCWGCGFFFFAVLRSNLQMSASMTEASAGLKTREAGSAEPASPRSWMSAVAARHSSASPSLMRLSSRVQALRFQRAEEPFDDPAAAVEVDDPRRFGKRGRGTRGQQTPDDRTFARRRIDLVRLDEIERQLRRIAYPSAPAPIVAETEAPRNARGDNPYPLFSPSRLSNSCPHDADRTFHATIIHYVSQPARGQVDKVKAPRPLARC